MAESGTVLPFQSFSIQKTTPWDFSQGCESPDSEAAEAKALTCRLQTLDEVYRSGYVERGLICKQVQDRALWRYLLDPKTKEPCHSFNAWLLAYAPWSRADCYAAMNTVERLSDIGQDQLSRIPRCNLRVMENLSTGVRMSSEVLTAAATMPREAFTAYVAAHHPTQHIEPRRTLRTLPASLLLLLEEAVQLAMDREGLQTWEQGLEVILADYLSSSASSDSSHTPPSR